MKPDFVIIGAQKAGSTALVSSLRDHPEVFMPRGETRYFRDPWFSCEPESALDAAVAGGGPNVRRRGIKCPDLLALPEAPERIAAVIPHASLIAMLRDPISRAVSAYFWGVQWGLLPLLPIEVGMRKILAGTLDPEYPRSREILEYGRYGRHLERYFDTFPRRQLLILISEETRTDEASACASLAAFLRIDAGKLVLRAHRNVNPGVYASWRLAFLRRRHRYVLRSCFGSAEKFVQAPVGIRDKVADRTLVAIDRLVLSKVCSNRRPALSRELLDALTEYYRADTMVLEQVLGRRVPAWRSFTHIDPASAGGNCDN